MGALVGLIIKEAARRIARQHAVGRYLWLIPLIPIIGIGVMILFVGLFIAVEAGAMNSGNCGPSSPIAPEKNVRGAAAVVRYLESQSISANGAAGIEGNLEWESGGLNPESPGGGLAQWLGGRWTDMVNITKQWGYPGNSTDPRVAMQGQLMYVVYDLRGNYAKLLSELNSAPDPATAATMFETVYEVCSGVIGYMQVVPNSLCHDSDRQRLAAGALQAAGGGSTVLTSYSPGGSCTAGSSAGYVDPTKALSPPGGSPSRIDMGVDYTGTGPILAVGDGVILSIDGHGWPGISFILEQLTAGSYAGKCWYYAEHIQPVVSPGDRVVAGQEVGLLLAGKPWSELGWANCSSPGNTIAVSNGGYQEGLSTAAGVSASKFIQSLGGQPGILHAPAIGTLPAGYP